MKYICLNCRKALAAPGAEPAGLVCPVCRWSASAGVGGLLPGCILGDYLLLRLLGQGATGMVFLAESLTEKNLQVAVKVLRPQAATDPELAANFFAEASALAGLSHPNTIRIYGVKREQGFCYTVMEYVQGLSLLQILKGSGRMSPDRALMVAAQVGSVLKHLWDQKGLVHNDIKPENIIVTSGSTVKLMDLGLTRKAGPAAAEESIQGTPAYMAPERLMGTEHDFRSDMYSLGATLYHLLTGVVPFIGRTVEEIAMGHLTRRLTPPNLLIPEIGPYPSQFVQILMAKRPEHRYITWDDMLEDVALVQAGRAPAYPLVPDAQLALNADPAEAPPAPAALVSPPPKPTAARPTAAEWWVVPARSAPVGNRLPAVDAFSLYQKLQAKLAQKEVAVVEIPANVQRMVKLLNNPNFNFNELVELVSRSPGLAGEFLFMANSARYNRGVPIADLRLALPRIAPAAIRSLLYVNLARNAATSLVPGLQEICRRIVGHSLQVAAIASYLAQWYYFDTDDVYVAGLMHDIGKIIMLRELGQDLQLPKTATVNLTESSFDEVLPIMHERAGAMIAAYWQLPPPVCAAIGNHHTYYQITDKGEGDTNLLLAALISVSDTLARLQGQGRALNGVDLFQLPVLDVLNMTRDAATLEYLRAVPEIVRRGNLAP